MLGVWYLVSKCFRSKVAYSFILVMLGVWYLMSKYDSWTYDYPYTARDKSTMETGINILIIAYFRSGSTFLGSMFDANKDIFYTFEPLRAVDVAKSNITGDLYYLDGSSQPIEAETSLNTIRDIFSCHLDRLSINQLMDPFWRLSSKGIQYRHCLNVHSASRDNAEAAIRNCLPQLVGQCRSASIRAIKTIRLPMSAVEELLKTYPSLKVLHLVRDHRPTLHSQMKMHFNLDGHIQSHLQEYSRQFCEKVYDDVSVTMKLLIMYPDRIKLLFYEDLTADTKNAVHDLYDFLGLPFRQEVTEHIAKLKSKEETNCVFCLGRGNVTHQLVKWRLEMNFNDVQVIQKSCKDLMHVLGLIPSRNATHLRNLKAPLRRPMKISDD